MYCHDCGTANTVDSKYCKECGGKINDGYRTMMLSVQDLPADGSEENVDRLTRLLDMAFWHNEAGNAAAAITAAEAALAISPDSTTAHSLLGTLYEKQGNDAQAITHFEAVLALNPHSAADAAKLDQIRRGVHVKAVAAPITHQLVPPALLRLGPTLRQKWTSASGRAAQVPVAQRPLLAAATATALVLGGGLLLMRPWANAETVSHPMPASFAPAAVSASQSAFAGGLSAGIGEAAPVRPMVLTPGPSASPAAAYGSYPAPALTANNPFAGRVLVAERSLAVPPVRAVSGGAAPRWSLPPVPPRTAAARRRRPSSRDLPTLRLAALPPVGSDGELAPAPVTLPPGMGGPTASVAAVPQHTVVVGSLPGASTTSYLATPSSHIRITVHQAPDTDAPETPAPASSGGGESSARADSYQQRALSLQQQGAWKQARLAYSSAIRAYQAQIASGHDVETAQRGLAACQTGLQICQQSQ